jgi:hypothetical protein
MENERKVSKRIRRICGKYMENMANWGYLRYTKLSPNTLKVFKHIRRIRGKNQCVHGEDVKRLWAYSRYTP